MKIHYQNYRKAAKTYKKDITTYNTYFDSYVDQMKKVRGSGIVSGKVADGLDMVITELERITAITHELPGKLDALMEPMLEEIHQAQKADGVNILYSWGYPDVRDYSYEFFTSLMNSVEAVDYDDNWFLKLLDKIEDNFLAFQKWRGKCDISTKENLTKSQKMLLQYKDVTLNRLRDMRNRIWGIDEEYGAIFTTLDELLNMLDYDYLAKLDALFANCKATGNYVITPSDLDEIYNSYLNIADKYSRLEIIRQDSDEAVEIAIRSEGWLFLQDDKIAVIRNFLANLSTIEISDWSFWRIVIFQMFNITEAELISQGGYEQMILKKNLLEMMEDTCDSFNWDDTTANKGADFLTEILNYIKKGGKLWKEEYEGDKRFKEYRDVVKFLDKFGNLVDLLEYGDEAVDLITTLFADYSKNLEYLNSIERYYASEGNMAEAFADIRALYERELEKTLIDFSAERLRKEGVKQLYKLSVGKTIGAVKKTIGIVGEITDANAETAAELELIVCGYDMLDMAETAFQSSVKNLQGLQPGDEGYATAMADVKNNFTMYKATLTRMFKKMVAATDGVESDYYQYCLVETAGMGIGDYGQEDLMTLEEYKAAAKTW